MALWIKIFNIVSFFTKLVLVVSIRSDPYVEVMLILHFSICFQSTMCRKVDFSVNFGIIVWLFHRCVYYRPKYIYHLQTIYQKCFHFTRRKKKGESKNKSNFYWVFIWLYFAWTFLMPSGQINSKNRLVLYFAHESIAFQCSTHTHTHKTNHHNQTITE